MRKAILSLMVLASKAVGRGDVQTQENPLVKLDGDINPDNHPLHPEALERDRKLQTASVEPWQELGRSDLAAETNITSFQDRINAVLSREISNEDISRFFGRMYASHINDPERVRPILNETYARMDEFIEGALFPADSRTILYNHVYPNRISNIELSEEKLNQAVSDINERAKSDPNNPEHYYELGKVCLEKVLRLSVGFLTDDFIMAFKKDNLRIYIAHGLRAQDLKKYRSLAEDNLDEAIESGYGEINPDVFFQRGLHSFLQGKVKNANHHFKKALEVSDRKPNPNLDNDNLSRAEYHYYMGLTAFSPFARKGHFNPNPKKNNLHEVEHHFQEAVRLNPNHDQSHLQLGLLSYARGEHHHNQPHLSQREYDQALAHFEDARNANDQAEMLDYYIANAYEGMGNFEKALEHYKKERENKSDVQTIANYPDGELKMKIGEMHLKQGNTEEALTLLRNIVDPVFKVHELEVEALRKLGRYNDAETEAKLAISRFSKTVPQKYRTHTLLASVQIERYGFDKALENEAGDFLRAMIYFEESKSLDKTTVYRSLMQEMALEEMDKVDSTTDPKLKKLHEYAKKEICDSMGKESKEMETCHNVEQPRKGRPSSKKVVSDHPNTESLSPRGSRGLESNALKKNESAPDLSRS